MKIQEPRNNIIKSILFVFLIPLFWSCGNEVIIDQNREFENEYWNVSEVFETQFDISDTINNYNFFLTLRNTDDYSYQNLFVFLKTTFPNGKSKLDTINCPLANRQGKWLGKGFAGIYDNRVLYMARKRFPLEGNYTIRVEQAMRDDELAGILDIGIRIEKAP